MKQHTTNYTNTFIVVAQDCPAVKGETPPDKGGQKTVAGLQFEMLKNNPYQYTSDDVLFQVYALRNQIPEKDQPKARGQFFSKGQACMRSSPLAKRYGWGIHNDEEGRIALFGRETAEYQAFSKENDLKIIKAMRSSRK